jgi:tetratricopeptide (TPR) repeat protein
MRATWLVTVGVCLSVSIAKAAPTRWQRMRLPSTSEEERLIEQTEERLLDHQKDETSTFAETLMAEDAQLYKARAELEQAKASSSNNWKIRLLYGKVMFGLAQWEAAREAFSWVVDNAVVPEPVKVDAYSDLAIAEARTGNQQREVETYERGIALEPMPAARSTMMANQAEAFMVSGLIERAIEGYRGAVELLSFADQRTAFLASPTTYWSLGVALDRAGDLEAALINIERARAFDPKDQMLSGSNWFFVPPYDEAYYRALGHWLTARRATDIETKVAALEGCVIAWRRYLAAAAPADHWLAVARSRLALAENEFRAAQIVASTPTPTSALD